MFRNLLERMPLVLISVAYLTGIVTGHTLPLSFLQWFSLLAVFFFLSLLIPHKACSILWIGLLCYLLGGMNYTLRTLAGTDHLTKFEFSAEPDSVIASVEQAEIRSNASLKVRLKNVRLRSSEWQTLESKIILTIKNDPPELKYGDRVKFASRINRPAVPRNPGEFDYQRYLANHHIYATAYLESGNELENVGCGRLGLRRFANIARLKIEDLIDRSMSGEQNAILKALIVGVRGEISDETVQTFVDTGVIHVLAVSGLHVGYVTLVILLILGFLRVPRKPKMLFTIGGLFFYALMVDLRPSVSRAVIMAAIILFAQGWEKRVNVYNTLAAAALIQTLYDPLQLFDMGFQLSFMAVFSIVFIYRRLVFFLPEKFKPGSQSSGRSPHIRQILNGTWQLFLVSLSALLGTLPITIYYFQRIPIISMAANLFVVPLVGLIGAMGFGQVILGFIWNGFNLAFGEIQMLLIGLLKFIVGVSARFPIAYLTVAAIPMIWLYFLYLILFSLLNLDKPLIRKAAFFCFLIGINIWIWRAVLEPPILRVTFFDVGQGDAALVELPNRKKLLIDTGDRTFRRDYGESVIAPFLRRQGIRRIDFLALSHPHNDHIGGAPYLMQNFRIGEIWAPEVTASSWIFGEIDRLADSLKIPVRHIYAGDYFVFADSLCVYVLHPSKTFLEVKPPGFNDYSNVLKISYRKIDFLFCGDAEEYSERYLTLWRDRLNCEIIKVPHHGSSTSSSQPFITLVNPDIAVVSVGKNNKFHHPSAATLARYASLNVRLHRTDSARALVIESDGSKYWIKSW